MPEGDTIHRAAARIAQALAGRVPSEIQTPHPRHRLARWPERLSGRAVRAVQAHGKHLFVRFEGGLTVHSHLRMTGRWSILADGEPWRRGRHRAWLVMAHGRWEVIQFDGPLLELERDERLRRDPRLAALGPDVLGESFAAEEFVRRLRRDDPLRPIGVALLDQRTIAGLGNLWKAESCFAIGVDPWRELGHLSDEEALALVAFARERMQLAVREGPGARPQAVYGRAGRACPRCSGTIRSRGQGDQARITFWCPHCQR